MQKKVFLLLFVLPLFAVAQKNLYLGQGVVKVDITQMPQLSFFADTSGEAKMQLNILKDSAGEIVLKSSIQSFDWLLPEQLFLNYDLFVFRVDTIIGKWMRVYTDNDKGEKYWTTKTRALTYFPWPEFFRTKVSSVSKDVLINVAVRTAANEQAPTIKNIEDADCFKVLEVKGDWLHIRSDANCSDSKRPVKSGWIRWRKQQRLLISYALLS